MEYVDFDSVKNQIVFRIINGRMNEKELQSLAHIPVMNLAVIFVVQFGQSDEMGVSIRISKKFGTLGNKFTGFMENGL